MSANANDKHAYVTTYLASFKTTDSLERISYATEDMTTEQSGHIWDVCDGSFWDSFPIENGKFTYIKKFYLKKKYLGTIEVNVREDTEATKKYRNIYVDICLSRKSNAIMVPGEYAYGGNYDCVPELEAGLEYLANQFNNYNSYTKTRLNEKIEKIISDYFTVDRKKQNLPVYLKREIEQFIELHQEYIDIIVNDIIDDYGNADRLDDAVYINKKELWSYLEKWVALL